MRLLRHISILLVAAFVATSCNRAEYRTMQGATWGTTYHIQYKADHDLSDVVLAQMALVDSTLSPFNPNSLISKINRNEPALADSNFCNVFRISQWMCSISDGMFDPTVSPIVNLWGFGYKDGSAAAPDSADIAQALLSVGILDCAIDNAGRVAKKSQQTEFNFSAIAKGYGVDLVAQALRQAGCQDFMVEIGGEIALAGKNRNGEDWHIQIDAPDLDTDGLPQHNRLELLSITNCAIATSGNYRNFRVTSDGIVGHTMNPVTGYPVASRTLSATIILPVPPTAKPLPSVNGIGIADPALPSCALADALATTCMALPADRAMALLDTLNVPALLVIADPCGQTYALHPTPLWPNK